MGCGKDIGIRICFEGPNERADIEKSDTPKGDGAIGSSQGETLKREWVRNWADKAGSTENLCIRHTRILGQILGNGSKLYAKLAEPVHANLHDQALDKDLGSPDIELLDDSLQDLKILRRSSDHQRIRRFVGSDHHVSGQLNTFLARNFNLPARCRDLFQGRCQFF